MIELSVLPCDNAFVRYLTLISAFYLPLLGFGLFHFWKMLSPLHHKGPLLCLRVLSLLTSYPVSAFAKAKPSEMSGGGYVCAEADTKTCRFVFSSFKLKIRLKKNKSHFGSSNISQLMRLIISNPTLVKRRSSYISPDVKTSEFNESNVIFFRKVCIFKSICCFSTGKMVCSLTACCQT